MSTSVNKGSQQLSFDYKAKAKGQEFNKLLYSIIKPGVYKGLTIVPTGTNFISITSGYAFINCLFQGETTRTTLARFSTQINSLQIPQTNSGEDEVVYLYFEYKELVENWVGIYHKPISSTLPVNSIILGTISYDGSGNIISVSYNNRQLGLFDEDYSLSDQNTFSNYLDNTKKSKLDLSNIPSGVTTSISLPSYDYGLSTIDDWQTARRYNEKEFVVYEGTIYRCVTAHTSTSFFTDLSNWESLNNIQDKEIIRGFNNTASGLSQSRVVTISGDNTTEEIPEVDYISSYSQEPLGIVIQDITSGTSGELQQRGRLVLTGVDLSSGVVGQKVYSDSTGNLTMSITALEIGQLLYPDTINPIIYVAILPTEEGLNVINFNGQLSTLENTIQKAFDRLDDYGYIPIWASGQTYRISNVIVRPSDNFSLWACLTPHTSVDFTSDISNWIQITDQTAIKYSDRKDIISNDPNLSVSGGTNSVVQSVSLDFSDDPVFNSVSATNLFIDEINISSSLAISGASGILNNVNISDVSFIKFYQTVQLTGISAPVSNKLIFIYNDSDTDMFIINNSNLSSFQNRIITNTGEPLLLNKNKSIPLIYDTSNSKWKTLSLDDRSELLVNQTAHGFTEGKYLIYDKNTLSWKLANSIGVYVNGTIGYVSKVVDVDNFIFHVFGKISEKIGLVAGEFYYVTDDGSGLTTVTEPNNQIQAVLFSLPNNKVVELNYPSVTPVTPVNLGIIAKGYNKIKLSFVNDTLTYYGSTEVNGLNVYLNTESIAISGSLGWRYVCCSNVGEVSIETIPVTEIISDISQYTPEPILNTIKNGYYSSVNPDLRIVSILFFDGINILECINYGDGADKNDAEWESSGLGVLAYNTGDRLQYLQSFSKTRGTLFSAVDNSVGTTDNEGFRITALEDCDIIISGSILCYESEVTVRKNGSLLFSNFVENYNSFSSTFPFTLNLTLNKNDYITFAVGSVSVALGNSLANVCIKGEPK